MSSDAVAGKLGDAACRARAVMAPITITFTMITIVIFIIISSSITYYNLLQ